MNAKFEKSANHFVDFSKIQHERCLAALADYRDLKYKEIVRFLPLYGYDAKGERAMGLDCTTPANDPTGLPINREVRRSAPATVISVSQVSDRNDEEIYALVCSDGCTREYNATKHRSWGYRSKYYDDKDMTTTADKINAMIGFTFFFYSLDGEDPDKIFFTTGYY
jgi:hypothetical protein